ncbi:endonuclease IV [Thermosipho melanesiensis]|uniref:Probable endonuclease 4 n=2 Tax=Thermosipho melanesiensis TaxID=46541 RepID=END4_THEM4|nr:deoxyribonuclease IV [Thermosipho melanesiensis]A6LMU8.1 RecName: Full=Probable endonuclease 4; AltName: Full=Endodeoxyribonuclease IV; AltName: Full=Endonuclease IV [Thermosipho melanesiensis BI429]ABR31249.1 apurinic endonuclease Apn1 [Thermosipho melanesiensis BI429]APT74333.1 endonuclease IV [Thermosipho melanesiensis]OOC36273.1 endonuclease IV [Thermosipho melanesiensis]OOC37091.1 endonuclease IV [Thermosipho melanesiensis]OOC37843.1 endonuclease IV [Thermosipho melanesiensis]
MIKIGAHMPISGGFKRVPKETHEIGGNAFQIFPHNPRQWKAKLPKDDDVEIFKKRVKEYNLTEDSMLCHSGYLINIASPKEEIWQKSLELLILEMNICKTLGIRYLNIHPGSHLNSGVEKGINQIVKALNIAMEKEKETFILLENVTKKGGNIGSTLEELKMIIEMVKYPERIGITIDTCHAFDAGYDITNKEKLDKFLKMIDKLFSLEKLKFIHLNDSKNELGSNKDRHENIGKGKIGVKGLKTFLTNETIQKIPWILETPGDNEVHKNDIKEVFNILGVKQ